MSAIDRAALVGAPAKVTFDGGVWDVTEPFPINAITERVEDKSELLGTVTSRRTDRRLEIPFTPRGHKTHIAKLYPFLNMRRGTRVLGAADAAAVIASQNLDEYTIHAACITKMPDLFLGVGKNLFGQAQITGLVKNNTNPTAANSFMTKATAVGYTDPNLSESDVVQAPTSGAFGARTGFTAIAAKEGWQLTFSLSLQPIKVDGLTREYIFDDLTVAAKCIPVGPTQDQILTEAKYQGSGAEIGSRDSANADDLVLTSGGGLTVTLVTATLTDQTFLFGGEPLRNGEVAWVTNLKLTNGVPGARITIA